MTSVHFLKRQLLVGVSNYGFEVVDVETMSTQTLLDPTVSFRELKTAKSVAICRYPAGNEFLACYDSSFPPSLYCSMLSSERDARRIRLRLLHHQVWPSLAT